MAGNKMIRSDFRQFRLDLAAPGSAAAAAGMEWTPGGRISGVGYIPSQNDMP